MNRVLAVIVLAGLVALPLVAATAEEQIATLDPSTTVIAALPEAEAPGAGTAPVEAQTESEDLAPRRADADRNRNQALARALLLLMTGGGNRPFPLVPR
jgi:hypothetical protein